MRISIVLSVLVLLWLVIGLVAAFQRGYFGSADTNCSTLGSTAVTVFVGPLNYVGVNPTVECPSVPQPSE